MGRLTFYRAKGWRNKLTLTYYELLIAQVPDEWVPPDLFRKHFDGVLVRVVAYDVNIIPALHKHAAAVFGGATYRYSTWEEKREKRSCAVECSRMNSERTLLHVRDFLSLLAKNRAGKNRNPGENKNRNRTSVLSEVFGIESDSKECDKEWQLSQYSKRVKAQSLVFKSEISLFRVGFHTEDFKGENNRNEAFRR